MNKSMMFAAILVMTLLGCEQRSSTRPQRGISHSENGNNNINNDANTSGGSGGPTSGTFTYRSNTLNSSGEYMVSVPSTVDTNSSHGLIIFFHGSNGGGYSSSYLKQIADVGSQYNLMAVVARTPAGRNAGWGPKNNSHGDFLHDLIQNELFVKYNINKDQVYFVGSSGGSEFITAQVIPRYGHYYKGGAIPTCGGWVGNRPNVEIPDQDWLNRFKIHFYISSKDKLYSSALTAENFYKDRGFTVTSNHNLNSGHCNFRIGDAVSEGLPLVLNRN